jgi:hypothetical protein
MTVGWNMVSYLPQDSMPIANAMTSIATQLVLVKNGAGQIYWPDTNYNLNSIGNMQVGSGYQVYMSVAASLVYPVGGPQSKAMAADRRPTIYLPNPRHFALSLNTGSNAAVLARRVMTNGASAPDSSEVAAFDSKGNLVGSGVVVHGMTAFSVWGKSVLNKNGPGCDPSEPITFKLWDGKQEYSLEFHGDVEARYAKDGLFEAAMAVPSANFISKFALGEAYPNPFRDNIRISFDVPEVPGKSVQQVQINVYNLKGSLVARLADGKFTAGHYSVSWNGGNAAELGSNMYIVEMKAVDFEKMLKLYRVK